MSEFGIGWYIAATAIIYLCLTVVTVVALREFSLRHTLFYLVMSVLGVWGSVLFLNVHAYVVIEVKTGKFKPEYSGQLGTYVVAVDHQLRREGDNNTIGILVCKDKDNVVANYALESSSQPLGVSSYELSKLIPDDFKSSLPTIEEIERELSKK